jgi:hypothetical protein
MRENYMGTGPGVEAGPQVEATNRCTNRGKRSQAPTLKLGDRSPGSAPHAVAVLVMICRPNQADHVRGLLGMAMTSRNGHFGRGGPYDLCWLLLRVLRAPAEAEPAASSVPLASCGQPNCSVAPIL